VLVIEDNLCNNYCNISLKARVEIFYISEYSVICMEERKIYKGAKRQTKIRGNTGKKTLLIFSKENPNPISLAKKP